jgi:hypothetical protein
MAYCSNCGTPYEIGKSQYCTKCGFSLGDLPNKKRFSLWFFIIFFILIVSAIIVPFLFTWIFGDCGPVKVARAIQEFDNISTHLINLEAATHNQNRPPTYLLSQIDGDMVNLSNRSFDSCIKPTANALISAQIASYNYFSQKPQEGGSPIEEENRYKYEDSLRTYYQEIGNLRSCQPFCKFIIQK